jgi:hypothetical protein
MLEFGVVGQSRFNVVRACLEERIFPKALLFASKIDRMNEGDIRLNKSYLQEQARQFETKLVIDSLEVAIGCD